MGRAPALEGWFTEDAEAALALLGWRCTPCASVFFPPTEGFCRNPACQGEEFASTELSRRGTVWSYTDAQYQPPPPYIPPTHPPARHRPLRPLVAGRGRARRGARRAGPARRGVRRA